MAKKRKKKQRSGVIAFLTIIAAVLILILALIIFQTVRKSIQTRNAKSASNGAGASAVITPTPVPSKDGDLVQGTLYDPNTDGISFSENAPEPESSDETPAPAESAPADESAASSEPETASLTENAEETVYVQNSSVNIRSGASTDSEVLGQAAAGTELTRLRTEGDWSVISYNGSEAYIKSEFLGTEKLTKSDWNLDELNNDPVNFGYSSSNLDANMVPTDWQWYESKWGQFNVDWIQDTSKNTIYLTMDEGFGNDNTISILDTLKEKNVNVTFFLTKNFVDDRPELVSRMLEEGHQLGNHTCTHPNMPGLGIEAETDQIMTLQNLVKDKFGYTMRLFRYPEGVYSDQSLGLVNNLGLKAVFWSFAYVDYNENDQPDVGESLDLALSRLHPGAIYLLHASSDTNTAMLGDFIDGARARGFEFGTYPLD